MRSVTVYLLDSTKVEFHQEYNHRPSVEFEGSYITVTYKGLKTSWPNSLILRVEQVPEPRW